MSRQHAPAATREVFHICSLAVAALCFAGSGGACAQDAPGGAAGTAGGHRIEQRMAGKLIGVGSFASIDVSAGPDRRPRRSLRFRFDSATRAMRSLGVDAEDCGTVLRTSRRATGLAGESPRPVVSLALSCRFF